MTDEPYTIKENGEFGWDGPYISGPNGFMHPVEKGMEPTARLRLLYTTCDILNMAYKAGQNSDYVMSEDYDALYERIQSGSDALGWAGENGAAIVVHISMDPEELVGIIHSPYIKRHQNIRDKESFIEECKRLRLGWVAPMSQSSLLEQMFRPKTVLEKEREKDKFFNELEKQFNENGVRSALDYMYDYINRLLVMEAVDPCNDILSDSRILELDVELCIGALIITNAWKKVLPTREKLIEHVQAVLTQKYGAEEVERSVKGFRIEEDEHLPQRPIIGHEGSCGPWSQCDGECMDAHYTTREVAENQDDDRDPLKVYPELDKAISYDSIAARMRDNGHPDEDLEFLGAMVASARKLARAAMTKYLPSLKKP